MIDLWGWGLILARFYDGYKYYILATTIRQAGIAKGHSRRFCNYTLLIDIFMLIYFYFENRDYYMICSTFLIIMFVLYYWWTVYIFYPYRKRGLLNFKRPNIMTYIINSWIPNNKRKRL